MAKNEGKKFEEDLKNSFEAQGHFVLRLQDAGGWSKSDDLRFTPSNICDFILHCEWTDFMNYTYLVEAKSVKGTSLPFGNINMKHLQKMVNKTIGFDSLDSIFLVNFRKHEVVFKCHAGLLLDFINDTDRKSVPFKWFQDNCTELKQKKKRTRFQYFF